MTTTFDHIIQTGREVSLPSIINATETKVAGLDNGDYVLTWRDNTDIYAQVFDNTNTPIGGTILVNTITSDYQQAPEVIALKGGGFVITWESYDNIDGNDYAGQIFNADGSTSGNQFAIPASGNNSALVALDDGGFALFWSGVGIQGRRFAPDGHAVGATFQVSDGTSSMGANGVSAATMADGNIVVTWDGFNDGDGYGVRAHILSTDLTPIGHDIYVNEATAGTSDVPTVAALTGGGFAVSWGNYGVPDTQDAVYTRVFDSDGNAVTGDIALHQDASAPQYTAVTASLEDGGFVVAWNSSEVEGGIYLQRFDASGNAVGDMARADEHISGVWPVSPAIGLIGNGQFAVGWVGSSSKVYSAVYSYDRAETGSDATDSLVGSALDDSLSGAGGNDTVMGEGGDDTLSGGPGADTIDGGSGDDTASYTGSSSGVWVDLSSGHSSGGDAAGDVLTSIENLTGSGHDDTLAGSDGDNVLAGGDGADRLLGNGGDDTIEGGAGADQIIGGDGNDTIVFDTSPSRVTINIGTHHGYGGDAKGDHYSSVENIVGSDYDDKLVGNIGANELTGGLGNDTIVANGGDDTVYGGDGDDKVYGRQGADLIFGGNGDDFILGNQGDDTLEGGMGADTIRGGAGHDWVSYAHSSEGVEVTLVLGRWSDPGVGGDAEGDRLRDIDNIIGSDHDDHLTGNGHSNQLIGGQGDDTLYGGAGADSFVFSAGDGNDVIGDFNTNADSLDLSTTVTNFISLSDVQAHATVTTVDGISGLLIDTGGGDTIFLEGLGTSDISAMDIIF